ncbi:GH92 family glycosyl hydrolase, partial [candidate division KSB1 bacterium]|nr:GH92 family glycosyl hydrolase [candidate division KSB1 bacterium]
MKRKFIFFYLVILFLQCANNPQNEVPDLTHYVNPLVGTDSDFFLSNGNTYPAVGLPWGMNYWTPQTGEMGNGWIYTYDAYKICGFRQTHQPSPWINDYGAFSLLPMTGEPQISEAKRASWFSHKTETVLPHYYRVYLGDYHATVEMTPTERCACFRITFPPDRQAWLLLDAFFKGSHVKIFPEQNKIIGWCRNNAGGVPENFKNYFVLYSDTPFDSMLTWNSGKITAQLETTGEHTGALVRFTWGRGESVNLRIGSSFISTEQAQINLKREIGEDFFDVVRDKGRMAWNKELNRIRVEGGTDAQLTTFYTALYRLLLYPRRFYELDRTGEVVHYSPYNGQVLPGYMFTDNGFWDTFRAVFPFFTLMYRELNARIMQGLVNTYKESGWLPEWASPGHRNCMIGSNSASIIADSYIKGIRGYDVEALYEAVLKNSENEGPLSSVGRYGVDYYNKLGYIPYDVDINENTARTLEYSYDDFCIYRLAEALGRPLAEINRFKNRAENYRNVFDSVTGFMRGKNTDGSWQSPFVAEKWGDAFTEGCAWHYTWSVFHDPQGLIDLMGGRQKFAGKLDAVFTTPPVFDYSYYGIQIHEITEMVIAGMGQYAHGNQPVQHTIYLYNYTGEPWKAQERVREVMDILYTPLPDGLCGDEDNGQTSAWYVFSALGFY